VDSRRHGYFHGPIFVTQWSRALAGPLATAFNRDCKLQSRLAALPGIEEAGLVSILPLAPKSVASVHLTRPDQPPSKLENTPSTNYRMITPDYFRAMGIPLLAGRYFTEEDNGDRPPVVIVSSVLANNHFPDRSPIGQRVVIDDNDAEPRSVETVGVVGPVKQANLETPAQADMYLPLRQVHKDGVPWLRNTIYCVAKMNPQVGGAAYIQVNCAPRSEMSIQALPSAVFAR
jgi:putative ABC transport system permease protein